MAESLAIVGVIVPGVAMMFGIGALISAGALEKLDEDETPYIRAEFFPRPPLPATAEGFLALFPPPGNARPGGALLPALRRQEHSVRPLRRAGTGGGSPSSGHARHVPGPFSGRQYRLRSGLGPGLPAAGDGIRRLLGVGLRGRFPPGGTAGAADRPTLVRGLAGEAGVPPHPPPGWRLGGPIAALEPVAPPVGGDRQRSGQPRTSGGPGPGAPPGPTICW